MISIPKFERKVSMTRSGPPSLNAALMREPRHLEEGLCRIEDVVHFVWADLLDAEQVATL